MSSRRKIAITQRVMTIAGRSEQRDALDQRWAVLLDDIGCDVLAVPNRHPDPVAYLQRLGVDGLILSGGNDITGGFICRYGHAPRLTAAPVVDAAPARDLAESLLLAASLDLGWPVLGVCRGMQAINLFHGGSLVPVVGHAGTRHELVVDQELAALGYAGEVNSFHNFGIPLDGVAESFTVLAQSGQVVEAISSAVHRHFGIMWHPERNTPFAAADKDLLSKIFQRT